jgi:hypothetical protein
MILRQGQKVGSKPNLLIKIIARFWQYFRSIAGATGVRTDISRFYAANSFSFTNEKINRKENIPIDVLIVAAEKDFHKLQLVVSHAQDNLNVKSPNAIYIVVPHLEMGHKVLTILSKYDYIKIVCEDSIVEKATQDQIRSYYGSRYGWVLQQLLKIEFVKRSNARGVLVLDADTILLKPRNWLNSSGQQVLTPTWEYHLPYYEFLWDIGLTKRNIDFSFVPHHMLIQPKKLVQCLSYFGISNLTQLLNLILKKEFADQASPFSIDYEMYAQFMMSFHPSEIILEKWANLQINQKVSRESISQYVAKYREDYASISFHI